jgi:hypothetical protein
LLKCRKFTFKFSLRVSQRVQWDTFFSQKVQKTQSYATSINYILIKWSIIEGVDATLTNSYSIVNENNICQTDVNYCKIYCQIYTVTFNDPDGLLACNHDFYCCNIMYLHYQFNHKYNTLQVYTNFRFIYQYVSNEFCFQCWGRKKY